MPATVVVSQSLFPESIALMRESGLDVVVRDSDEPVGGEGLAAMVADADALLCQLTDAVDESVLAAGPRLRVVATCSAGFDHIDVAAASRHGVAVTNTPGVLHEDTADLTFALILASARRVVEGDAFVRAGRFKRWTLHQEQLGLPVHGARLGIVGMGQIGRAVARRAAHGFGMEVCYHSRTRLPADIERELGVRHLSFEELLGESDVVSLHAPLTPATHHLVDDAALQRMKPTAILVNTSRGPLVDEAALARALGSGQIAGAGLDVYEDEPRVHPDLLALTERVVLLPHLGSATEKTRRQMAEIAATNVVAALTGDVPPNVVNAEAVDVG
ncbi:2-hydroxyacid dehydrogenase [Aeromicrobium sp. CTD01-1L150]|uniref:2-hydroxyacid dehydrogenase n=1 Tax=Aeromicrobium sp. CTD01-1L150 TaxID=3341830 RepID=UPI0035BFAE95